MTSVTALTEVRPADYELVAIHAIGGGDARM